MTGIELESLTLAKAAAKKYLNDKIDWEQRRYEIAKDILPMIMWIEDIHDNFMNGKLSEIAEEAVRFSDALIEELRKPKK